MVEKSQRIKELLMRRQAKLGCNLIVWNSTLIQKKNSMTVQLAESTLDGYKQDFITLENVEKFQWENWHSPI